MTTAVKAALESLGQIKSTEPPLWVVPKQELSQAVRVASQHLFSALTPHAPKSPFDKLLIEGFDAEQIWQQIDLQSHPLLSSLRREVKKFEKHPEEISKLRQAVEGGNKKVIAQNETDNIDDDEENSEDDDMNMDDDDDEEDDDDDEEDDDEEEEDDENEDGRDEEEKEEEEKGGVEDKFLKIKELQDYLEKDEAREFGLKDKKKTKRETKHDDNDTELKDDEGEQGDDDEEEDELGLFDGDDDEDGNARF